jgi:hypothetical protein
LQMCKSMSQPGGAKNNMLNYTVDQSWQQNLVLRSNWFAYHIKNPMEWAPLAFTRCSCCEVSVDKKGPVKALIKRGIVICCYDRLKLSISRLWKHDVSW